MPLAPASKYNNYHYNKSLKSFANANRKTMTKSAACLWKYILGGRQMLGYKFRRERPVLNYIADFACLDLLLIIEVDGITHDSEEANIQDRRRDQELSEVGFTVLRFSSYEVINRIDDVSNMILEWINGNARVLPQPPRKKRVSKGQG